MNRFNPNTSYRKNWKISLTRKVQLAELVSSSSSVFFSFLSLFIFYILSPTDPNEICFRSYSSNLTNRPINISIILHFILFDPVYTGFYNYFSCYSSFMRNLKDERTKIWMLVKCEGLKFEKYKDVIYKTFFSLNFLDKKKKNVRYYYPPQTNSRYFKYPIFINRCIQIGVSVGLNSYLTPVFDIIRNSK